MKVFCQKCQNIYLALCKSYDIAISVGNGAIHLHPNRIRCSAFLCVAVTYLMPLTELLSASSTFRDFIACHTKQGKSG